MPWQHRWKTPPADREREQYKADIAQRDVDMVETKARWHQEAAEKMAEYQDHFKRMESHLNQVPSNQAMQEQRSQRDLEIQAVEIQARNKVLEGQLLEDALLIFSAWFCGSRWINGPTFTGYNNRFETTPIMLHRDQIHGSHKCRAFEGERPFMPLHAAADICPESMVRLIVT